MRPRGDTKEPGRPERPRPSGIVPAFPAALFPVLAQKVEGGMVYGGALRMVGEDERNWGL